jgi:dipeptidase D
MMDRQPTLLWQHFADLCLIPRGSGNEGGVRDYIRKYAATHGFGYREDSTGNCLVSVPGRGAGAHAGAIAIQAHMDMVCVADQGIEHDFTRDPIRTRVATWTEKGVTQDVLMATGTTLGADNGIGLVAALAVAVDPAVTDCPPLELLCTVDEETGLTGARFLDPELLRTDLLINLDSEEVGEICISCAGGRDMTAEWTVERSAPSPDEVPIRFFLTGLPGGHSGVQIHERRGNALKMLLEPLLSVSNSGAEWRLASFAGGTARNVIPGYAEIIAWVPQAEVAPLMAAFQLPAVKQHITEAIQQDEEDKIQLGCAIVSPDSVLQPISFETTARILDAIANIPNGVQHWSEVVDGLVETSNNVAVITTTDKVIRLQCSTRSSKPGAIEEFQASVTPQLTAAGATVTHSDGYPGWPADAHNPLLVQAKQTFKRLLGHEPKLTAVHAGLECGVLQGKRPTLQMISFGPNIYGAHTVNERITLDSVPQFYACLTELLSDLAKPAA